MHRSASDVSQHRLGHKQLPFLGRGGIEGRRSATAAHTLKLVEIHREEIESLIAESVERPAARAGQRALAEEVTTLVHGAEECHRAITASQGPRLPRLESNSPGLRHNCMNTS